MGYVFDGSVASIEQQRRIDQRTWLAMYAGVLLLSALLGLITLRSTPQPFALPFTMLVLASAATIVKPILGLYAVTFFTMLSDASVSPWYPFTKNLSSHESILFVGDGISISPLEVLLMVTLCAWLLRLRIDRPNTKFVRGGLLRPVIVFSAFLFAGLVLGLATGGERYAAMWEYRPFVYLPIAYILFTNLFTRRRHYYHLALAVLVALVVHALLALRAWSNLSPTARIELETLVDHGSAIQLSAVLLVVLTVLMLPKVPTVLRWLVLVAAVPVAWVWLLSQRRAAVIGLAVSVILLGVLLSKLNPSRLKKVAPIFVVVMVGYIGAFWHSNSLIGFPAQALKTVIAPGQLSEKDRSSDLYRIIENYDISVTIHAKPITGFGFGHKFLRPIPLPNLSAFPFFEYIPHNSVLWIWVKAGVGGFVAMLYLFGSAVRLGVRSTLRLSATKDVVLLIAATGYVVMYLVFAYVDIAWDSRSMIAVAAAMAICSQFLGLERGHDGAGGHPSDRSKRSSLTDSAEATVGSVSPGELSDARRGAA